MGGVYVSATRIEEVWREREHGVYYIRDTPMDLVAWWPAEETRSGVVQFPEPRLLPPAPPQPLTKRQKRRLRGRK